MPNEVTNIIKTLAEVSGRSTKIAIIRNNATNEDFRRVLYYTYNPFYRYGIKNPMATGRGNSPIDTMGYMLLDNLRKKELTGHSAINAVTIYMELLGSADADLYRKIINKDLRAGVSAKTINTAIPGLIPTHDIMLAKPMDKTKIKFPCYGSAKIDGVRAIYRNGKFFSRAGHEYIGLDHIVERLHMHDMVFDGELVVPGKGFHEGSGLIRSDNPTPNARFMIFDVPEADCDFVERCMIMKDIMDYMPVEDFLAYQIVKHHRVHSLKHAYEFFTAARELGYEGFMLKTLEHFYQGKRSWDWQKMKNISEVEAWVTGIYEGKGKYQGQMGGVLIEIDGVETRVGGGWSDEQRERYYRDPSLVIDRLGEFLYHEKNPNGALREPRFYRWRDDKMAVPSPAER